MGGAACPSPKKRHPHQKQSPLQPLSTNCSGRIDAATQVIFSVGGRRLLSSLAAEITESSRLVHTVVIEARACERCLADRDGRRKLSSVVDAIYEVGGCHNHHAENILERGSSYDRQQSTGRACERGALAALIASDSALRTGVNSGLREDETEISQCQSGYIMRHTGARRLCYTRPSRSHLVQNRPP